MVPSSPISTTTAPSATKASPASVSAAIASSTIGAASVVVIISASWVVGIPDWRGTSFQLFLEFLVRLTHRRVPQVHLSIEVIRQAAIVIESAKVRSANVADLKFLMARRTGGVWQRFQLALAVILDLVELSKLEEFVVGGVHLPLLAKNLDLEKGVFNGLVDVVDLFELVGEVEQILVS
jgi:hypothetical protein